MVDRIKDKEELRLQALFMSDPVPDLDFSKKVMARVRRQMWIRRLTMPVALVIGALIAVKPASELVVAIARVLTVLPANLMSASVSLPGSMVDLLTQMTNYLVGGAITIFAVFVVRALAD